MSARRGTSEPATATCVRMTACLLVFASACGGTVEAPAPPAGPASPPAGAGMPAQAPPATNALGSAPVPGGTEAPAANATPDVTPAPAASPTPVATPAAASPPNTGGCPAEMVRIQGGTFKLAAIKQEVTVKDYCLDVNEVTADLYAACVQSKACNDAMAKVCDPYTYGAEGKGNMPMVCIDFAQATAYCKAQNKRLPTGEEWEWAARGGSEGRTYPWGNDAPADQLCWSGKTKRDGPCAVGSFPGGANPHGVLDLAGNVFEWTTTGNDLVSTGRFGRGGSWRDSGDEVKAGRTAVFKMTYRCGFLGIRCAISAP